MHKAQWVIMPFYVLRKKSLLQCRNEKMYYAAQAFQVVYC